MAKKRKKMTVEKIDGLSAKDIQRLRTAVRKVWSWSYPRKLCVERAIHADGFPRCENKKCPQKGKPVIKVYADHIKPVGAVDGGFIARMWTPSRNLQALCKKCHDKKTREERKAASDQEFDIF